jgi:GNAT superfamily N-acetyltransferase
MATEILEKSAAVLPQYARVPIAFRVKSHFRIEALQSGLGGLLLIEESVTPYIKDYDAIAGEGPLHWPGRWDLSNWSFLCACHGTQVIGGAAVAWKTTGLNDLEGRDDVAVLWDLRVHPDHRGYGVGHRLFTDAAAWARARQCRRLKVETQNINVPACRFYARQGCELGAINRYAYDEAMDEIQLIWFRPL